MPCRRALLPSLLALSLLAGCATRSTQVAPLPANPADFATWDCARIDDELDSVRQRAADLAWAVDEHAGNNIIALGLGVTVFWPALLAMRPEGLEAADLARLKGRDDALRIAAGQQSCPPAAAELSAARAQALPVALGERLVYEDRRLLRQPPTQWALQLTALRRGEIEYTAELATDAATVAATDARLVHDLAGNVISAPPGALRWPHLLRGALVLGQVTAGDILIAGDPQARARMRGQVVAQGPQTVAGRRFEVRVIELFGDVTLGEGSTRVDGVIVVDRASGVLLRLDLRSAQPGFALQRRLVRVDAAAR